MEAEGTSKEGHWRRASAAGNGPGQWNAALEAECVAELVVLQQEALLPSLKMHTPAPSREQWHLFLGHTYQANWRACIVGSLACIRCGILHSYPSMLTGWPCYTVTYHNISAYVLTCYMVTLPT